MTQEQKKIEQEAHKQVDTIMYHLDRLISSIDSLDKQLNKYRGLGLQPGQKEFYISKKFSWPLTYLRGLKMWQRKYQNTFKSQEAA